MTEVKRLDHQVTEIVSNETEKDCMVKTVYKESNKMTEEEEKEQVSKSSGVE